MLRITDAERSVYVSVPREFIQTSSILSDMMESRSFVDGKEEIALDVPTEIFKLFISWLFHLPDFTITKDNVKALLEMAHKYNIPRMTNDIGDYVVSHNLITPEYGYALGASFSVSVMESTYRPYIVQNIAKFFLHQEGPNYIMMLAKLSPEKIHPLLKDTLSYVNTVDQTILACKKVSDKLSQVDVPMFRMIGDANFQKQRVLLEEAICYNYDAAKNLKNYEFGKAKLTPTLEYF